MNAVLIKLYQNLHRQIASITIDYYSKENQLEVHAYALGYACFFYNLYTWALGMGNQVSGMLGMEPPSIHEYLFSVHNDLLAPLPGAIDEEADLLESELHGNETYYYVV